MNVEQAFIKTDNLKAIKDEVFKRLSSIPDKKGVQPDVGLPSSYDSILINEPKRKIAISEVTNEWVSILESKEVNDYKMLLDISKELNAEVIAIVLSDITASCGFAEIKNGNVIDSFFSEDEEDFEGIVKNKLSNKGIEIPICMFREVASRKISGWEILTK